MAHATSEYSRTALFHNKRESKKKAKRGREETKDPDIKLNFPRKFHQFSFKRISSSEPIVLFLG